MPRRTFRRRRRFRRKPLAKIVRSLQLRNAETKHQTFTSGAFDYVSSISGNLINLTQLAQGTGDSQRIGNKLTLNKIMVSKVFRIVQSNTAQQAVVRILLLQSRAGALTTADMPLFYGPCNLDKFIVFKDIMVPLSAGTSDYATGQNITINPKRVQLKLTKFYKRVLHYADASLVPNTPVYLFMLTDQANTVEQAGYDAVYFKDL